MFSSRSPQGEEIGHFKSGPSPFPFLSTQESSEEVQTLQSKITGKSFANSLLCIFPNSTTLIDSSLRDWILISRQLPKQFTTEQNIKIMVGIIKMPLHSNIVSSSVVPTHNWFLIPTKKQLYDQQASICELPSAFPLALAPGRSGKAKHILVLILLFPIISHVEKKITEILFVAFPKIGTSKKFNGLINNIPLAFLSNTIVKSREAVEEG